MLRNDRLVELGVFIKESFLSSDEVNSVLSQLYHAESRQTLVLKKNHDEKVQAQLSKSIRQTEELKANSVTTTLLEERLSAIKPSLESYFNLQLNSDQGFLFYRYKTGDFFKAHRDNSKDDSAPSFFKQRRISIIIFLNKMASNPLLDCYCGGNLVFYGLIDNPQWQSFGFGFSGKPGTLVAFRSNVLHEVKPVTAGERYTVVNWLV